MTTLHAQPYDTSATGFYFDTLEEYETKSEANKNDFGGIVEEYELQFIDGDNMDCKLFTAFGVNQANFADFFEKMDEWDDNEKLTVIIAAGECGYSIEQAPAVEVDIYEVDTMRELAEQFIDEGLFGEIPEHLVNYIDLDAIARDLSLDYSMINVNGVNYAYRCQ